jgi:UDP-N-acetylglucosamine 2-epimerase (non-hydrolysing)
MTPSTLLAVAGTRPELLKLAPVIRQIRLAGGPLSVRTCFSGQHVEILESVLGDVDVPPDIDLRSLPAKRSLSQNLAWLLEQMDHALGLAKPDGVIVQGDTNTVLAAAIAAFHHQLPSFHVEAGLRTARRRLPFPEEINRRLVSRLASLHFAPTGRARQNLLAEGIDPDRAILGASRRRRRSWANPCSCCGAKPSASKQWRRVAPGWSDAEARRSSKPATGSSPTRRSTSR